MSKNLLAENSFAEAAAFVGYGEPKVRIMHHDRVSPDMRARFAMELLQKWGLVMAKPDGDDTSGRQKVRLADPGEVARHACDISENAFAFFEQRGWLLKVGSLEQAKEVAEDTN